MIAEIVQIQPNPWMALPFVALLAAIAVAPLLCARWWHSHYPKVALGLGAVTLLYYLAGLHAGARVAQIAEEYLSFICLIGSLYVVSGGIHINVKGEATPLANVVFLLIGALVANLLGTTGASMLLIQPWLRMNKSRVTAHHVVFFIFIVSNVGGCLTPIGDPPLFLGYLAGVPFWWVIEHCWPMWAMGVGILLAMFFVVDTRNFRRAPKPVRERETAPGQWRFTGLANLFFLVMILGAVFINKPPFLREALMFAAAAGSYFTTKKTIHEANHFNFHPVQEVAILFAGIFATMIPALDWLQTHATTLGQPTPGVLYWSCGGLSAVLDNAPTYLAFLSAIFGSFVDADSIAQVQHLIATGGTDITTFIHGPHSEQIRQTFAALQHYHGGEVLSRDVPQDQIKVCFLLGNLKLNASILAISVGAVFFGATTYIGNGPNFMVKTIADQQKVHMPTFLDYIWKFTLPFMLPMLLIVWLVFFRASP